LLHPAPSSHGSPALLSPAGGLGQVSGQLSVSSLQQSPVAAQGFPACAPQIPSAQVSGPLQNDPSLHGLWLAVRWQVPNSPPITHDSSVHGFPSTHCDAAVQVCPSIVPPPLPIQSRQTSPVVDTADCSRTRGSLAAGSTVQRSKQPDFSTASHIQRRSAGRPAWETGKRTSCRFTAFGGLIATFSQFGSVHGCPLTAKPQS